MAVWEPTVWLRESLTTSRPAAVTLLEAVRAQAPRAAGAGWICPHCAHYDGGVTCAANVFIALVGGDLSDCQQFAVPEIPPG